MLGEKEPIYQYQPLWGAWLVDERVGSGGFGTVYRVSRQEYGQIYTSAVKIITIPGGDLIDVSEPQDDQSDQTRRAYYRDLIHNLVNEVNMLYSLSGNSNILAYHDHKIIEHKDKLGWDILIRMDFVKPLSQYMAENRLTRLEIVNLGIDLCSALDICARHGIVHRDIKEENIFIDNDGIYKLGDFGIAMRLAKRSKILFKMGTPNYMAPEVYHNEDYNAAVDLYSLGIVLYKMLNHGRLPHIPAYPIKSQPQDSQAAFEKRMSGETYAKPDQAGLGLAKIIMKACAYRAVDRYETPLKMKQALEKTLVRLSDAERGEWVTELVVHPPKARLQSRRLTTIRQDHPHSDRKTR